MNRNKIKAVFILGILVSILVACGGESAGNLATLPPTIWSKPPFTDTPSFTPTAAKSQTPSATQDLISQRMNTERARQSTVIADWTALSVDTEQARQSTAIAIATAARATHEQMLNDIRTQMVKFSVSCDKNLLNEYSSQISPDGNWFAASCGYKRDQTLIVKSRQGITWVLEYKDFFVPEHMGSLFPVFWSPDREYLYFSGSIGYSGGGNQCFPQHRGKYGLFQLNLNDGLWTILIPPTESFPGYEIEFSPTGRRYAISDEGITIADVKTGDIVKLNVSGLMKFSWSPDGRRLAYSIANCDESGKVQSASVYVWDSFTNRAQEIFSIKVEEILLYPEVWIDNSTLRVLVEKPTVTHPLYEIYDFDIAGDSLILWGTATPRP